MLKAVLVAIGLLPVFHEDVGVPGKAEQLSAVAAAVSKVARSPEEAAFLLAWADAESHFSLRVSRGECRRWECDRGRARGPWQNHRNGLSAADWDRMHGVENIDFQAERAAKHARWSLRECRMKGDAQIRSAFALLGGKSCSGTLPDIEQRLAAYRRVRGAL
jgi:hypothetical protein